MIKLLENNRLHDITFHRSGKICIGARIARLLDLNKGDCINIMCHNGEYLLYNIKNPPGRQKARCYPSKANGRNLYANSVSLTRSLLDACNIMLPRASFMAGELIVLNNKNFIPIITAIPLLDHAVS